MTMNQTNQELPLSWDKRVSGLNLTRTCSQYCLRIIPTWMSFMYGFLKSFVVSTRVRQVTRLPERVCGRAFQMDGTARVHKEEKECA